MADLALKESKIPHFTREESASGMRVAMPAAPSMGPGVWWVVLVPEEYESHARKILAELPFEVSTNPDVWDSQPAGAAGRFAFWYRVFAILLLAYIVYIFIANLVRAF